MGDDLRVVAGEVRLHREEVLSRYKRIISTRATRSDDRAGIGRNEDSVLWNED